jgi:hypothetical protein
MTVNLFILEALAKARQEDLLRAARVRSKEVSR